MLYIQLKQNIVLFLNWGESFQKTKGDLVYFLCLKVFLCHVLLRLLWASHFKFYSAKALPLPENIQATKMSISCNSFEVCASQTEYTKMVLESRDLLEIL